MSEETHQSQQLSKENCDVFNQMFRETLLDPQFTVDQLNATTQLMSGLIQYNSDFLTPLLTASAYFSQVEQKRVLSQENSPEETMAAYRNLLEFNMDLFSRFYSGTTQALSEIANRELKDFFKATQNSFCQQDGETLEQFFARQFEMIDDVVQTLPDAIRDIEPEYGFHFERNIHPLMAETERFLLYRITPNAPNVTTDMNAKPILILPPYVLGSNILGFLPGENKSYAHAFANQGIPTYLRVMKDIRTTPAFQKMTMEEDCNDTRIFCEKLMEIHKKKVTLNGYCQGGYSAVCNILSGRLDDTVDALITCVAPMDGTRSKGLGTFLRKLPSRFNDLSYGTKTLADGTPVADGDLMGWVYKLKSIEHEAPLVAFIRDMSMVASAKSRGKSISKTALAINYWLKNERSDIPMAITQMSFTAYNIPVASDGTLPVNMFGNPLNFKDINKKKIPWLLCYGEQDDLVEKETALAPLDYADVETCAFPKGHVAIATSWSDPNSACALHTTFGEKNHRGPVKFQMDLNEAQNKNAAQKKKKNLQKTGTKQTAAKTDHTSQSTSKTVRTKPSKTVSKRTLSKSKSAARPKKS